MADEERHCGEQRLHHPYLAAERLWYSAFGVYVSGQDGASVFFGVSGGRRGPEVGEFIPIIVASMLWDILHQRVLCSSTLIALH